MQRNSSRFKTPRVCKIHRKDALLFFGGASCNETLEDGRMSLATTVQVTGAELIVGKSNYRLNWDGLADAYLLNKAVRLNFISIKKSKVTRKRGE